MRLPIWSLEVLSLGAACILTTSTPVRVPLGLGLTVGKSRICVDVEEPFRKYRCCWWLFFLTFRTQKLKDTFCRLNLHDAFFVLLGRRRVEHCICSLESEFSFSSYTCATSLSLRFLLCLWSTDISLLGLFSKENEMVNEPCKAWHERELFHQCCYKDHRALHRSLEV